MRELNKGAENKLVIEEGLKDRDSLSISVGGELNYVVLIVDAYKEPRLAELEFDCQATLKDIEKSDFVEESADDHVKRLFLKQSKE